MVGSLAVALLPVSALVWISGAILFIMDGVYIRTNLYFCLVACRVTIDCLHSSMA